jgi:DNA/RNA endonuclease YhcR with UshA esterase domain
MTFIIWSRYKDNFNNLNFNGKTICAKGVIKEYKGRVEMFIKTQKQIKIK